MFFKIVKISLFHLICCLLGMGIVAINLTFAENHSTEIILYTIFSVVIIIAYFIFGYKFIDYYNEPENYISIWIISLFLVLLSFVDFQTASMVNMPFQPLGVLLSGDIFTEKGLCIFLSLIPSTVMQIGYILRMLLKR